MSGTTINPLDLSDEDFSKLDAPVAAEPNPADPVAEPVKEGEAGNEVVPEANPTEGQEGKDPVEPDGKQTDAEGGAVQPKTEEEGKEAGTGKEGEAKPEGTVPPVGSDPAKPVSPAPVAETVPVDHKAFYDRIMTPFKANGKTIELKSPEEAIQLMQMGANYTRKLQAIQPHRKMLTMLENNGLLDEDRISYLIDLDKKNPEAIKKLIKDSGIDPMDIDASVEPNYQGGGHKVSDNEVSFRTNLDELGSTPAGKETLVAINTTWDESSKQVLWAEPSLMPIIHAQRETGIYDRIVSEMDRRKMLGSIAPETSFLQAYKDVGDSLEKSGAFSDITGSAAPSPAPAPVVTPAEPVATRVAAPKAAVENGDKANAASPTRSTSAPAKPLVNPLGMSDDDFMAQFKGRI